MRKNCSEKGAVHTYGSGDGVTTYTVQHVNLLFLFEVSPAGLHSTTVSCEIRLRASLLQGSQHNLLEKLYSFLLALLQEPITHVATKNRILSPSKSLH